MAVEQQRGSVITVAVVAYFNENIKKKLNSG
jgi:hypothetical protein